MGFRDEREEPASTWTWPTQPSATVRVDLMRDDALRLAELASALFDDSADPTEIGFARRLLDAVERSKT